MQKYLLPLIAVLAILAVTTYYLSSSDDRAYYEALSNFIYIDDIADEHKAFTRIDKSFSGDCEDFAFTLQLQIGGEVWAFTHNDNVNHAALVLNGMVYDSLRKHPVSVEKYPKHPLYKMAFNGELIAN
jgi:ABC-type cobalt transport system substrate-binding protein